MPLPDDVYARYYVRECENCNDGEVGCEDDELIQCGKCTCDMCEDCWQNKRCGICDEKECNGDVDAKEPAMCDSCKELCQHCNTFLHRKCKVDHVTNCNPTTRAKRTLSTVDDKMDDLEDELMLTKGTLKRAKRRIESLQEEIQALQRSKAEAAELLEQVDR
jgi:hypothetical protein